MRFVVFVAASLASLVAGDEALSCPAPPVCDYSAYEVKVKELTSGQEACLQAKAAELAAKEGALAALKADHAKALATAQAEVEQFRKTVGQYKEQSVNLEKQVTTLQSQVAKAQEADELGRRYATLEKSYKDLAEQSRTDIATQKAALETERKQSLEKLSSCETTRSSLEKEFQAYKHSAGQYESKYSELKQETEKYKEELGAARRQLDPLVMAVYSKSHVNYAKTHVTRIGTAFLAFAQKRFTGLVGPDFVKLVKLQATVWGRRAHAKAIELGAPLWAKAQVFYTEKLEAHCSPIISQALEFKDKQSVVVKDVAKDLAAKFLVVTERSMDRMIRNLSSVDPTIGEVFGHDFTDRCFAFAFVLFCFYVASSIVSWLFHVFIGAPFCWLFGIGKSKTKKSKKAASKSGRADATKGKNSTVKGSLNTKEGMKSDGKVVGKAGDVKADNGKTVKGDAQADNGKTVKADNGKTVKGDAKKTADKGTGDAKLTNQKKGIKA